MQQDAKTDQAEPEFDFEGEDLPVEWEGDDKAAATAEGPQINSWLENLNKEFCAVIQGGRYRIMRLKASGWSAITRNDFLSMFENRNIQEKTANGYRNVGLGAAWQKWHARRTAEHGTTFDPKSPPGSVNDGKLNLWTGFGIEPRPHNGALKFTRMIRDTICGTEDDNDQVYNYLLDWIAWKVQNPGELPGVAIAIKGAKGTGKGTLGETLVRIFGHHGMATSSMDQIGGRFNGHLETMCFVFADEAFWSGDHRHESAIKKLITDREAIYEHKGITSFTGRNRVALMFATNDDWVVPASADERRYLVLETAEGMRKTRGYWDAIHQHLDNGGRAAFLWEMLNRQLPPGWHPRNNIPQTRALADQKARSLKGLDAFYFERLEAGQLMEFDTKEDWEAGSVRVTPGVFFNAARDYVRARNPMVMLTMPKVMKRMKRFGWTFGYRTGKARYWVAPPLAEARARFESEYDAPMFEADTPSPDFG